MPNCRPESTHIVSIGGNSGRQSGISKNWLIGDNLVQFGSIVQKKSWWNSGINANLCQKFNFFIMWTIKLTSSIIQLAFDKKIETLWLMFTVTSRNTCDNSNLNSHRVPIPSIINKIRFSNGCSFSKAKWKTKSKHAVLGLWQRSFRLHNVVTFWRNWPFISQGSGIIKIFLLPTVTPYSVA